MAPRKVFKIEKRAAYEFNIVKNCRQNYFEKLKETQSNINKLEVQETLLIEKGKNCDETEKKFYAREIKKIRECLDIKKDDFNNFQDNVDLLDQMITLIDSFILNEQFRYIVRKIPEKKLPKMVRNPHKQYEINDLLTSLLNDFYAAQQQYLHSVKQRQEKRNHILKVKAEFRERNDVHDADLLKIIEELNNDTTHYVEVVQNHENFYKNK